MGLKARRQNIFLVSLALALGLGACGEFNPYELGYAWYWVEFEDTVIVPGADPRRALCADDIRFLGDIDYRCARTPMAHSWSQTREVRCYYRDAEDAVQEYTSTFRFKAGYIAEPPCGSEPPPQGEDGPDVVAATDGRDALGRFIVQTPLAVGPADLDALYGGVDTYRATGDDDAPRPTDLGGPPSTTRTSEVTGDP